MPAGALLAALPYIASAVGSGLSYLTGRQNMKRQSRQNEMDRKWELDMYNRQRGDALADMHYQNAYNSPSQQMQRLREAGLNPYMIYGGGSANMTASLVRGSQSNPSAKPSPRMNEDILPRAVGDMLAAHNSVWQGRQIQAQTDNLREQNAVLQKEAILKAAQAWKTIAETDKSKQDYRQADRMNDLIYKDMLNSIRQRELDIQHKPLQMEETKARTAKAMAEIDKVFAETKNVQQATKHLEAQTNLSITQNEIAQLMKAPNLNLAIQELLLKRSQTIHEDEKIKLAMENLTSEQINNAIQEFDEKMRKEGVYPGDPYYYRMLVQMWARMLGLDIDISDENQY